MTHITLKIALIALVITGLWGCGKEEQVVKEPVPRPVKTILIEDGMLSGARHFPGRVDAVQKAQVSFRVSGKLQKIYVKEGDKVKKGQILAELDPTDFQITLNNHQATYNRTKADYTRGKELVKDGYISRSQFDKMKADFTSAKSNLNKAKQDLKYTKLRASFAGLIGKRYVDNFEEIQAKQEIFNLSDTSAVEVKISVSESLMQRTKNDREHLKAFALFDNKKGKKYPLALKEVSATADPQTQTFDVTFVMPQPEGLVLLPGMTANVRIEGSSNSQLEQMFLLPITAVKGASDMSPTIFVVDPETNSLKAKVVKVGSMQGEQIRITDGIDIGDRVVIAGVAFMREGDKVTLMKLVEQADPATAP